jgi:hypothetical protein
MGFASTRKIAALLCVLLCFAAPARAVDRLVTSEGGPDSFARACNAYGASYFTVPGSDLCLALGGAVAGQLELRSLPPLPVPRAGAALPYSAPAGTSAGSWSSLGGAFAVGFNAEARLPTEAGLVSGYVSAMAGYAGGADPDSWRNLSRLDQAYLQFAGWTAGRAQSVFDFYADAWNFTPLRGSNARTEQLSYSFAPAAGVTARMSLENNRERQAAIAQTVDPQASVNYEGPAAPDLVGAVRVDNPFGGAQVSAAAHELRTRYAAPASVAPGQPDVGATSQWGFAAQGGLKVNLPSLSEADAMILQATYARGASAYVAGDTQSSFGGVNDPAHPGIANPGLAAAPALTAFDYDCVVGAQAFGRCDKSSGYAIVAALKHFWTPTVSSSLFASFFGMTYPDSVKSGGANVAGAGDYRESTFGGNLVWTPVKSLMVGVEGSYSVGKAATPAPTAPASGGDHWTSSSEWSGRIRVQHNF